MFINGGYENMDDLNNLLSELISFCESIRNLGVATNIDELRKKFIELKERVRKLFPKASLFNKKIWHESDFDYKLPQMQEECKELIDIVIDGLSPH
jgi:hypothetical protein